MRNLETLDLSETRVTSSGVVQLASLHNLRSLSLYFTGSHPTKLHLFVGWVLTCPHAHFHESMVFANPGTFLLGGQALWSAGARRLL